MASLGRFTVPGLFTIHAPGVGRVINVIGSRRNVTQRMKDRKANGEAFPRERLEPVKLALSFDGAEIHAYDIGAGPVCAKCDTPLASVAGKR